jgi:hypothetical protein
MRWPWPEIGHREKDRERKRRENEMQNIDLK